MWYKIVFKKNGNWSFSVFKYEDEAEKKTKLERWKAEHVSPYNKIEVIWHGEYTDEDLNYPPAPKYIKKKSIWVIYAKLMQFFGRLFRLKTYQQIQLFD